MLTKKVNNIDVSKSLLVFKYLMTLGYQALVLNNSFCICLLIRRNLGINSVIQQVFFSEPETSYEEEMQILRVIEAYCNLSNAKTQRHTFSATSEYCLSFVLQIEDFLPKKINQPMKCLSLFPSLSCVDSISYVTYSTMYRSLFST